MHCIIAGMSEYSLEAERKEINIGGQCMKRLLWVTLFDKNEVNAFAWQFPRYHSSLFLSHVVFILDLYACCVLRYGYRERRHGTVNFEAAIRAIICRVIGHGSEL